MREATGRFDIRFGIVRLMAYTLDLSGHQRWDVAPDGRFLMVENSEDFQVVIVEGFFEELKRLVPKN